MENNKQAEPAYSVNRYLIEYEEQALISLAIATFVGNMLGKTWSRGGIFWPSNQHLNRKMRRKLLRGLRRAA